MHISAGCLPGNPLAAAVTRRRSAVQRCSNLESDQRSPPHHPAAKPGVQVSRSTVILSQLRIDSRRIQYFEPLSGNLRVRINHRRHNPLYASINKGPGARSGTSGMRAGLKAYKNFRSFGPVTGRRQGANLRMRFARTFVPPFSDNLLTLNDETADPRVGLCGVEAILGKGNSARDKAMIPIRQSTGVHRLRPAPGSPSRDNCVTLDGVFRSLRNRSISLLKAATSSKLR